jgi:hypothetical protein
MKYKLSALQILIRGKVVLLSLLLVTGDYSNSELPKMWHGPMGLPITNDHSFL